MIGSPGAAIKPPALTLVLGGARSGKSRLAERLVCQSGLTRHYIATAEPWDAEMQSRIAAHRIQRGQGWKTWEVPRDIAPVLASLPAGEIVLLDCATLWLTNQLLAGADVAAETDLLLTALAACAARIVVVSNEVGWSIVPDNALSRAFSDHQGRLNQRLAAQAGLVVAVMAGLPLVLKGAMPDLSGTP